MDNANSGAGDLPRPNADWAWFATPNLQAWARFDKHVRAQFDPMGIFNAVKLVPRPHDLAWVSFLSPLSRPLVFLGFSARRTSRRSLCARLVAAGLSLCFRGWVGGIRYGVAQYWGETCSGRSGDCPHIAGWIAVLPAPLFAQVAASCLPGSPTRRFGKCNGNVGQTLACFGLIWAQLGTRRLT